jgi:hypothetical protein
MIETLWANLGEGFKFEIAGVRDKRVLHSCVRCSTVVLSLIYFFHEIFQTTSIYHILMASHCMTMAIRWPGRVERAQNMCTMHTSAKTWYYFE